VSSSLVLEAAGHGLHLALFVAGLVTVTVLLVVSRPSRRDHLRHDRARRERAEALRRSLAAGRLDAPPDERS